jgi:3-oxoacyl-[acyl-carrier-protein] synthase-3
MIGIKDIGSYIPVNLESNYSKKAKFEIEDDFISKKIGVEKTARKSADEETSDLCIKAFSRLQEKSIVPIDEVDCIVVCTQNPDGNGIPHTSSIVHGKLNQSQKCASFDISLGCSGYIYALSIVKSFMESNGLKSGLLFTADPYSKIIDPNDRNTVLLFGDAATVTHLKEVEARSEMWILRSSRFLTRGKEGDALNNNGSYLVMNGRAIFNFACRYVPLQIKELLDVEKMTYSAVDLFVFHQASKFILDQLRKMMELPQNKVPVKLAKHGNTVSSSIPLILEDHLYSKDKKNIVISGFGVGLSVASGLLSRHLK